MNKQSNIEFKKNKLDLLKTQLESLKREYKTICKSPIFEEKLPTFSNDQELLKLSESKNRKQIDNLRKYNSLRDSGVFLVDLVAEEKNSSGNYERILNKMDIIYELGFDDLE